MLKEIKYHKKPSFLTNLENKGGVNYKVYEKDHLTILCGQEPKGKNNSLIYHITVNSKKRYSASKAELDEIALNVLPKGTKYKIKKSFFMKTVSHIYEI